MLAWFVLSLGAAIASPLVSPKSIELICTGTGVMKVLVKATQASPADDAAGDPIRTLNEAVSEMASAMLDCPLCLAASAPPPYVKVAAVPLAPLAPVQQPMLRAPRAVATAVPRMAHAPPAFS